MKISSFKKIIYAIMAITIGIVNYGCSKDRGTRVVIKGSTTVLPITQKTEIVLQDIIVKFLPFVAKPGMKSIAIIYYGRKIQMLNILLVYISL